MRNFKACENESPAKARSREERKDSNYSNIQHPTSKIPNLLPLRPVWKIASPVLRLGKCVGLLAVMVLASGHLNAQVTLAGWDFNGQSSQASNPLSANNTASNITVGGLTLGSGLTTSSTASTFGGTNWTQGGDAATAATNNDFISLTLTANAGYTISLNGISAYNIRRSGSGISSFLWQYQLGSNAWTDISSNLAIAQQYRFSLSTTSATMILAGHQDNGTNRTINGTSWSEVTGGDGMDCLIDRTNNNLQIS